MATARVWDADVEVTAARAAGLIEGQFPELAPARLEPLGEGWDNVAYAVNGQYVFRLPRRKLGAELMAREARVLPRLAPHLPLPIPLPLFVGEPADGYPYPFAGYAQIPGVTACRAELTDAHRSAVAAPLARSLAALHALPVEDATRAWAPGDDIRRADLAYRVPWLLERMEGMASLLEPGEAAILRERIAAFAGTPQGTGPTCWVHGDLYARHLLVDAGTKQLSGVIDWGDVHLGDRVLDLSIAFSFLPPPARAAFRAVYGESLDAATWERARFRALFYGIVLTEYGAETGDVAIEAAGRYALRNAPM